MGFQRGCPLPIGVRKCDDPGPWFAVLVRIEVRDAGPALVLVVGASRADQGTTLTGYGCREGPVLWMLHEVIVFACRALVAATKVIVAPTVVPKGHQVEHPEDREEVAAEGTVQAVGADVLLVVLREELQVAVDLPFGVPVGALDVVPDDVCGLVDVAAREAVDPDASELVRGDPRVAITEVPKGCSLQGGPLRNEPQCQRCSLFVLLVDALSGRQWGDRVLAVGALGGGLGCHDVNVGR